MLRDFWPIVVALLIALLTTLRPFSNITQATELGGDHRGQLDLRQWQQDQRPLLKLDRQWRYFPGQLLAPGQIPQSAAASQWVELPHFFSGSQRFRPESERFGSYLLELQLPPGQDLGLALPRGCNSAKVFFYPSDKPSGRPLFEVGQVSAEAALNRSSLARHHRPLGQPLTAGSYRVLIQVAGHHTSTGGLCSAPVLGPVDDLQNLHSFQQLSGGLVAAIVFSFGLYAVGTFIAGSRNRSYLWLGSNALLVALAAWSLQNLWVIGFGLDAHSGWSLAYRVLFTVAAISGPLIVGFVHHSYRLHFVSNRLINANLLLGIALGLPFALLPMEHSRPLLGLIPIIAVTQLGFVLYLLWQINRNRLLYARRITLFLSPLLIALCYQLATYLGWGSPNSYPLAAVVFLTVAQGLTQSQKLARASEVASRLSQGLSEAVHQRTAALHDKNQELLQTQKELTRANFELQALSVTDGLTRVYNRMYFDRQLASEWQRARREGSCLCLLLLDIDNFKLLNDRYGHTAGDEALRQVADTLTEKFKRETDFVCRYGGEEFVVILNSTSPEQALELAEQVRAEVGAKPVSHGEREFSVTVSIGVHGLVPAAEQQPLALIQAADQALYQAKRHGRNQALRYRPPARAAGL